VTQAYSTESGARWLIVEDESLVAMLIEETLIELGFETIGPVNRVANAIELVVAERLTGAILDVNLGGEPVYPLADALRSRGVPFVFLTGYGEAGIHSEFAQYPVLQKPFSIDQMQAVLKRLASIAPTP
jgi:DNA-binding response OmpR family regulator